MKKVLLVLFALMMFLNFCYAATPEPTKKVVIIYRVSDAVLQCQNADENMIEGAQELEKELVNHYSKRFIVEGIQRGNTPEKSMPISFYQDKVKNGQTPLIITIFLQGQGQSTTLYQNAFGAQKTGIAPAINVQLKEVIIDPNDNAVYSWDYGVQSYSAGTFAIGMNIYAAQTDPRKKAKNAIRACFRDACKFNEDINKYANPTAYENEHNRFVGNFKPLALTQEKANAEANAKIEKFQAWCNADEIRKAYLAPLSTTNDINFIISYIDNLAKIGVYTE